MDTVQPTLAQTEQRFVQSNLQLLTQRFDVTATQTQILQARLWENPVMSAEQNIHNSETGYTFDLTRTDESILQVQQLVASYCWMPPRHQRGPICRLSRAVQPQGLLHTADPYCVQRTLASTTRESRLSSASFRPTSSSTRKVTSPRKS